MNPIEEIINNFQHLVGLVHETLQPFIVMIAGAIPFIEGEVAAMIGVVGGINPILAGLAGAIGNFLAVLVIVFVTSRARTAVVSRNSARTHVTERTLVTVGAPGSTASPQVDGTSEDISAPEMVEDGASKPESKGRKRFKKWLVRFGVPGASIIGPLAIPTHFTAAILVAGGTPRRWVLLWQAVAIAVWTTVGTVSVWAALTYLVGV